MNYWIGRIFPDAHGNQWVAWYIDPRTGMTGYAGPYLTADAAFIITRWQACH